MRHGAFVAAALLSVLMTTTALAQTTPADPLAPGTAAQAAKDKAAKPSADKTEAAAENPRPGRAKPRRARSASVVVTVHTDGSVGLVELQLGPAGETNLKKVVGQLAFG